MLWLFVGPPIFASFPFYLYVLGDDALIARGISCKPSIALPRQYFSGSFVSCVSHAFTSVHCCLVVTCWERAGLLALVGVYCICVTFPFAILVSGLVLDSLYFVIIYRQSSLVLELTALHLIILLDLKLPYVMPSLKRNMWSQCCTFGKRLRYHLEIRYPQTRIKR